MGSSVLLKSPGSKNFEANCRMRCSRYKKDLAGHAAFREPLTAEAQLHLRECAECAATLRELHQVTTQLDGKGRLPEPELSPRLNAWFHKHFIAGEQALRHFSWRPIALAGAALAVAVLVALINARRDAHFPGNAARAVQPAPPETHQSFEPTWQTFRMAIVTGREVPADYDNAEYGGHYRLKDAYNGVDVFTP